jgi:hypothetical protein
MLFHACQNQIDSSSKTLGTRVEHKRVQHKINNACLLSGIGQQRKQETPSPNYCATPTGSFWFIHKCRIVQTIDFILSEATMEDLSSSDSSFDAIFQKKISDSITELQLTVFH